MALTGLAAAWGERDEKHRRMKKILKKLKDHPIDETELTAEQRKLLPEMKKDGLIDTTSDGKICLTEKAKKELRI